MPTIPGTVQFENYDAGGAEVAYHDTTTGNSGGQYRTNHVDVQATTDSGGTSISKSTGRTSPGR